MKTDNGFVYAIAMYKNGDEHELYPHEYELIHDRKISTHKNEVALIQNQDSLCTTTKLRIRPRCSLKSFPISVVFQ